VSIPPVAEPDHSGTTVDPTPVGDSLAALPAWPAARVVSAVQTHSGLAELPEPPHLHSPQVATAVLGFTTPIPTIRVSPPPTSAAPAGPVHVLPQVSAFSIAPRAAGMGHGNASQAAQPISGALVLPNGDLLAGRLDIGREMRSGSAPAMLRIPSRTRLRVDDLRVAPSPGTAGVVIHDGGFVSAKQVEVGGAGAGTYQIASGGRLDAGTIALGVMPASQGLLHVANGEVRLNSSGGGVTVGVEGTGRLVLGSPEAPGRVIADSSTVSAPILIGATDTARDSFVQGWGTLGTGGALINNGRVVADGHNLSRGLDLRNFTSVGNTIDNPANGGTLGWFASRGGRVELPTLRLDAAPVQTVTWGESNDDATLDLVNSLRLTIYGQSEPADVDISLRTVAAREPLDVELPSGVSVLSLYEIASEGLNPSEIDVLIRYNDAAAAAFYPGESALQLMAFEADGWQAVSELWLDRENKWIGGTVDGPFDLLAVTLPWDWSGGILVDEPPVLPDETPDVTDLDLVPIPELTEIPLSGAIVAASVLPVNDVSVDEMLLPRPRANVPEPMLLPVAAAGVLLCCRRRSADRSA
jgi:hypothetical protein